MLKESIILFLAFAISACNEMSERNGTTQDKVWNSLLEENKIYEKNGYIELVEIEYYSNGKIKSIREHGSEQLSGIYLATHYHFDSIGDLEKQVVYKNNFPDYGTDCKDIMQKRKIYEFYPKGKINAAYQFLSHDKGGEHKIGDWIFLTMVARNVHGYNING